MKCKYKSKDSVFSYKGWCSCRKIDEHSTELCECKGKCKWTLSERKNKQLEVIEEEEEEREECEAEEERENEKAESEDEENDKEDLLLDALLDD